MVINLHNKGFNLEGVPLPIRQKLELILLSYDNINWIATRKKRDDDLNKHLCIFIKNSDIYASHLSLPPHITKLDLNDFIKNH